MEHYTLQMYCMSYIQNQMTQFNLNALSKTSCIMAGTFPSLSDFICTGCDHGQKTL